jgi:WD40 repeat protein
VASRRGSAAGTATRKEVELCLWDVTTGKELPGLRPYPGEPLSSFSPPRFSRDGKRLAFVGSLQGRGGRREFRLKVLDCDTGRELLALADLPNYPSLAFDATGGRLAVLTIPPGKQGDCQLTIWDVASRQRARTISLAGGTVVLWGPPALSPDGTRFAAVTAPPGVWELAAPGQVRAWDTGSGQEVLRFKTGPYAYLGAALAYSPDGKSLAAASRFETSLKLRDAASGELLLELAGQGGRLWDFAYSPDGARLASASEDGKVRLWDVAAGGPKGGRAPARVLQGIGAPLGQVAFSADGRLVSAVRVGQDGADVGGCGSRAARRGAPARRQTRRHRRGR